MYNILSIDLGGQSAKVALFDEHLNKKTTFTVVTKIGEIFENLFFEIIRKLNELNISSDDIDGIGIGVPGFVSKDIIKLAGNLQLKDYDVACVVKEYFPNSKVVINNDANAAALGEYYKGSAKDFNSAIFYVLGTGLGGAIILNGHLINGENGFAGEFGHGGHFQNKYKCTCGLDNCIEATCSGIGIEKAFNEFAISNELSNIGKIRSNLGHDLKLIDLSDLIKEGDADCIDILTESLTPLAYHISTMIFALNVDGVVLLGGPTNLGDILVDILNKLVKQNCLDFISETFTINIGELKNDGGMIGNALSLVNQLSKDM